MSFRTKIFLIFLVTTLASVSLVAYGVTHYARAAYEQMDQQRTEALVSQFQKEFEQAGQQVAQQVENITNAELTLRMALDLAKSNADASLFSRDANGAAQDHGMEFVEFVNTDGTVISSAQFPSRVGTKNDWVTQSKDWRNSTPFLRREELPDGSALALTVVRTQPVGDKQLYVIGGRRLDQKFLASLVVPAGTRALLYRNLDPAFLPNLLTDKDGLVQQSEKLEPIIEEMQKNPHPLVKTINWSSGGTDASQAESFHTIPLFGRNNELLAILMVGSSQRDLVMLTRQILETAVTVAAVAVLISLLLMWWITRRVTRPLEELTESAREVASGRWDARIDVNGVDEVGQLATAFNDMTRTLGVQRERLLQTERVAAWRELARRLAHELRNPLFPLQITVENMQRARKLQQEQFLEVFNESTATLKAELANLNVIVGRFSDFSKMPTPRFMKMNVNEALRNAVRLFEPQFHEVGKPTITPEFFLKESLPEIDADPELIHKAFQNLVLNALDAMPAGGTLTLRTSEAPGVVRVEVADTGKGLTPEECSRLFTPYYTTKQIGTGLGLAIVQSVISDHHGTVSVTSEENRGTTFRIELPQKQARAIRTAERPTPAEDTPQSAEASASASAPATD